MSSSHKVNEARYRSIAKSLSWRFCATLTTMIISYFITGSLKFALSIGSIEVVAKLILFYFHERMWNGIGLGRKHGDSQQSIA